MAEEEQKARFKEQAKRIRKDKISDVLVKIMVAFFFINILTTIVFGILTLFSKLAFALPTFIISACITVAFIILIVGSRKKNN